jgi:hypothetical protein
MSKLDRRPFTSFLAAAIITLGLITPPPPNVDVASSRVEAPAVQLAAATTSEISTTAVNTFVRLASAVSPASLSPTSGTDPAAPSQGATNAAAGTTSVADALALIATIALGLVYAPFWYLAFPITLPISYALAAIASLNGDTTAQQLSKLAFAVFFDTPFSYAKTTLQYWGLIPTAASTDPSAGPVVSTASVAASAPTSVTQPTAPSQHATNAAALPPGVTNALAWIGTIALGALIAPIWYLAFPLTLFTSYALTVNPEATCGIKQFCFFPPWTKQDLIKGTERIFFEFPFALVNAVLFPGTGPFFPPASLAASAPTTSDVKTKPVATNFAQLVTTTLNTVKAQTGAAAPILPTVTPKPLNSAVKTGPVVGKPQVSHSGSLRTAVTSTTSTPSNTVKHAIDTISKKAQN